MAKKKRSREVRCFLGQGGFLFASAGEDSHRVTVGDCYDSAATIYLSDKELDLFIKSLNRLKALAK